MKSNEQVLKEINDSLRQPPQVKPKSLKEIYVSPERLVRVCEKILGYLDKVEQQNAQVLRLEGLSHKIAKDAEANVKSLSAKIDGQQRQINELKETVKELASLQKLSDVNESLAGRLMK